MNRGILFGLASLLGVLLVTFFWGVSLHNGFITESENVNSKWAQVQNNYQRRFDLIPNLVNTVKGESKFEQDTLIAVTNARAKVGSFQVTPDMVNNPDKLHSFEQAQGDLGRSLSRLMVVAEKYPELKANQAFRDLSSQLEGTENRITVARRDFNEAVQSYNVSVRKFPGSMIAGMGGFFPKPFFEMTNPEAAKAPEVKF